MSACRFSAILFHPDGSKALPRVSNPKAQKCTNPTFLGVITGILWWALREPGQGHITMALDQAEQIAKEDPGMARVALRVVRHDRFDDPIKVYSDVKDPVQRFTESVFGQAEHELEHTIIIPPSIISDALLEGPRASPGVVARVARRLLEIEKKVDGSPADRMALMYMVGIFLFHNLIQQGRRERLVTEIQFDCDDAMLLGIPGPELGPEFESDDEILNLIAEIPPQQEYHQEQEQRRYEDLEADAAVPHRRALLLGVESIVKAEMRTEAVLKNQAPAVKPSTAKTLFAILAQTQLTGSSDFDWLRAQASVCLSDEA